MLFASFIHFDLFKSMQNIFCLLNLRFKKKEIENYFVNIHQWETINSTDFSEIEISYNQVIGLIEYGMLSTKLAQSTFCTFLIDFKRESIFI